MLNKISNLRDKKFVFFLFGIIAGLISVVVVLMLGVVTGGSGGADIYYNDGWFGIGTTDPGAELELRNELIGEGDYVSMKFRSGSLGSNSEIRSIARSTDRSDLQFWTSTGGGSPTFGMVINQGGNVGIGTDSPTAKLDVSGEAKIDDLFARDIWITDMTGSSAFQQGTSLCIGSDNKICRCGQCA